VVDNRKTIDNIMGRKSVDFSPWRLIYLDEEEVFGGICPVLSFRDFIVGRPVRCLVTKSNTIIYIYKSESMFVYWKYVQYLENKVCYRRKLNSRKNRSYPDVSVRW
jgi:hypothetical protein